MSQFWMPLRDALSHVAAVVEDNALAAAQLRSALHSRKLIAIAREYWDHPSEQARIWGAELPPARFPVFWDWATIAWESDEASLIGEYRDLSKGRVWDPPQQEVKAIGIEVESASVARLWPAKQLTAAEVPNVASKRKAAAGRRGDFDWEKALIEGARWMMHDNGVPRGQADLVRHVLEWFGEDAPGETQAKEHLGPLYLAFKTNKPPS
ncbi:hypothetical protein FV242_21465 [Methylobacterium sp. WL64]|uniref:hypothetical protein n=1 Tax=Methylobacterium sp. WL64 TaxID=2603894 RepID=UPI0011CA369C|nr:hypothetical protein [Methylobacterium sp. WL64]TXN00564.1 hypothetical protein FV242_21465 [Methylobacterium sp. WL64]